MDSVAAARHVALALRILVSLHCGKAREFLC